MSTATARAPEHSPVHVFRRNIFSGEQDSYGTVLVAVLCQQFGSTEWFDWEPDVLAEAVHDDFGVKMPPAVRDKIWALVTALSTDLFWTDAVLMNHVANALTGGPTNMLDLEPAEAEEIAWAVIEVGMSDLEDNEEPPISPEIRAYVGAILERDKLPPIPPLEWAVAPTSFNADDAAVAAMQVQDRQESVEAFRGFLQRSLSDLHQQLKEAGVAPPEKPRR